MNKEIFEQETTEIFENNYQNYVELGGIINEEDYQKALNRMNSLNILKIRDMQVIDSIRQAIEIADYAEIKINDLDGVLDPKIVLFVILRLDVGPEGVKYHHSQMSDQKIFVEALRMLGDARSRDKMIKAYPNISFKYDI